MEIEPVVEYAARVRPELVVGGVGEYSLYIESSGNTEVTLDMDGADAEGYCRCAFSPNPAVVGPGSAQEVKILVKPRRRPFVEPARAYNLTFNVTPRQVAERSSLNARLEAVPYARKWYFPVALVALLLMVWVGYTLFWLVVERSELTYLRDEKWDDFSTSEEILHGQIGMLEFELASKREGDLPFPPPIDIRGSVFWPDIGDTPPTVGVVMRGPNGNCWGPKLADRVGEPFNFTVNDGGTPCYDLDYGWLLIDVSDSKAPTPAVYGAGEPLIEYCVRDVKTNPVVKFFKDGGFQTPYSLARDYDSVPASLPPRTVERDDKWSIYLVNPHPDAQWPIAQEVVVRLKAVDSSPHSWKKNEVFSVNRLDLPHPQLTIPRVQCGWDIELEIPKDKGGLEHGLLYVRHLDISPRIAEEDGEGNNRGNIGHYGCPDHRDNALASELRLLCADVTWEPLTSGAAEIAADNVFLILRHSHEGEARCWSKVEGHASPDSLGSPFTLDLVSQGRPCHEELTDPEQILWNLMNWNTFEPARYQGVQPLVKFCPNESGQALFDDRSAVPLQHVESWQQNRTSGWTLYVLNPSSDAAPPRVTVKLKGDQFWTVDLHELPNSTVGDTPLAPPGSGGCPEPTDRRQ